MKNKNAIVIMKELIYLIKPLILIMLIAIISGVLGFLAAIFITTTGGMLISFVVSGEMINSKKLVIFMLLLAPLRAILRYIEQYSNHYIAFRILAIIRDKVFKSLRRLAPSKLDGRDKGDLIAIITRDIELLEVFYAHTISPIFIALIVSLIMIVFLMKYHIIFGLIALISYMVIAIVLPIISSKVSKDIAHKYSEEYSELNSYFLESLRGINEDVFFNNTNHKKVDLNKKNDNLSFYEIKMNKLTSVFSSITISLIILFSLINFLAGSYLYIGDYITRTDLIVSTIAFISSFGAVTAVSNLGTGILKTIASAQRVLSLINEEEIVKEVINGANINFDNASINDIYFSYDKENDIIKNFSMEIKEFSKLGIKGKSGSGKSTLLRLIMRFFDVDKGEILISSKNIKDINTKSLRDNQAFVEQTTHLFRDSILENLRIANLCANKDEIILACKKASIHEFIMTLDGDYEHIIGEDGDTLSGGQKQRIGLARAFLQKGNLILLDEPTSNLDSFNEGVILNSIKKEKEKTFILVSHRDSTMNIADQVIEIYTERKS